MHKIVEPRISINQGQFAATCNCGVELCFASKSGALNMLRRGSCRKCKVDYRNGGDHEFGLYKRADGKWCSECSGCGVEQAYTRKDHARQSWISDWKCKKCAQVSARLGSNSAVGDKTRLFNKFKRSARSRGIEWHLTEEDMFKSYNGKCAISGWSIDTSYGKCTASLDRIDSACGYTLSNIQWTHVMVNMCKNRYDQDDFIRMCKAVANASENQPSTLSLHQAMQAH